MFGETLHCGELIKRLNDALGRKANNRTSKIKFCYHSK